MNEARDLAQNRPVWRLMSLHNAFHSYATIGLDWLKADTSQLNLPQTYQQPRYNICTHHPLLSHFTASRN